MQCSNCGGGHTLAKGLCSKCYSRVRRTGSLKRTNAVSGGPCQFAGCAKTAFARGYCAKHYQQTEHPLKASWKNLRSRYPGEFPQSWDSFDAFLTDAGKAPSDKHQLRRKDPRLPWSAENMHWVTPVGLPRPRDERWTHAAYGREWRLQRKFKITGAEYDTILAAQGGVCAGCKEDGTHEHHRSGADVLMHVDHDHATGAVRGILCHKCNTSLGLLGDDPARLERLAQYLRNGGTYAV